MVVDEAHVLTQCGEDFRSPYLKIGDWIKTLPRKPQILALSSTMTQEDVSFVTKSLCMQNPKVFRYPVKRDNLKILPKEIAKSTTETKERLRYQAIESCLEKWKSGGKKGSVIIYCTTVAQVNHLSSWLNARKRKSLKYHSKLDETQSKKNMADFMSGTSQIMVATSAFGMGIDKSDIRLIIHAFPPLTLTDYIQQIGRAGRDGKKAKCILFYTPTDWATCKRISGKERSRQVIALKKLAEQEKFDWEYVENHFTQPLVS